MSRKMPSKAQRDEYESDDFDETETMISRNKTNRPKSALGLSMKKSMRKGKKRPVTPGRSRAQSAQGFRTGKELWMNAIKKKQTLMHSNGKHGESPRHKTPIEFWVETLRKTGVGRSTESTRMNTFSGLKGGNEKFYPYLSTSHYMRTAMGTEKQGRYEDPTVKPSPGRPAYKTPEEYYDEVLELRKQISALNHDSATMKTKIRRLEEDNQKKEKEIESLLNPGKSEEIRRTLGDRKPDSGAVIHSLKQKILKLEVQLRDKESAHNKLQADMKVTKVEEMKIQMEALYQEIVRLQNLRPSASTKVGSENSVRVKALNETILRLSRANESLQQENKSLKEDLQNALDDANAKPDMEREYEDMNRRELLMTISKLEKEKRYGGDRLETDSQMSGASGQDGEISHSKLVLKGTVEQRLTQLDHRETELLDEIQRLKLTIKRLREERRKRQDEKGESLPPTPTPRRRASRDVGSAQASSSRRPSSARSVMSEDRAGKVDAFKERHAATSIQRQWRNRRQQQREQEMKVVQFQENRAAKTIQRTWREHEKEKHVQEDKVTHFRENRAAKKIQNEWLGYRHRRHEEDVDDAAYTIQAALNGHHARRRQLNTLADDDSSTVTDDDDVFLLQSSLKGHHARLEQMKRLRHQRYDSYEDEDEYYDTKSPGQSRKPSLQRPSSAKGSRRKTSTSSAHTFKPKYGSGLLGQDAGDDDDDDDIMF